MSDIEEALARLNVNVARVATVLEKTLLLLETLAVRKAPTAPTGPYYPATWGEPRPSHWPVMPAQPRDPRPSTITC